MYTAHASQPPDPFRNRIETINSLEPPSSAEEPEVPPAVLAQVTEEAGPKGTEPGTHCKRFVQMKQRNPTWGCPRIAQQIAWLSALRSTRMWFGEFSPFVTNQNQIRLALHGSLSLVT